MTQSLDERLAALEALRAAPRADGAAEALRRALTAKTGVVVAKAAAVAGAARLMDLGGALIGAFERLLAAPVRADPGCRAKCSIVDALLEIGEEQPVPEVAADVLLPGARHRQLEPVWGGRADTAGGLRSSCAAGLVRWNHRAAFTILADHLADPEVEVREQAARILAWRAVPDAVGLLRLRVGVGDEMRVVAECLRALFALDGQGTVPLCAELLGSDDEELYRTAALAFGESRREDAFLLLKETWTKTLDTERREVLAIALATLRRDDATAFLIDRVREGATLPQSVRDLVEARMEEEREGPYDS